MQILITILVTILGLALQQFLSTRKNFILGLILPLFIVIGAVLFIMFKAESGTLGKWIFRFSILVVINLSIYFEGRDKVKEKSKKELEKMTIQDL
ncbi:hypothetical protein EXN65_06800 [Clostridium botulinum]|uniref:Uncharacterized protein n=2 Tax=Clostridium botulinum TaxID=1491 RepID=A0A0A2HGE7_CLOBO|nr:hypothetical protein [Clostridium botulinum]ACQ51935.1 hypothetical protein CLJ_B0755 [Clostridium botulinum Ba4 str. 657]AJE10818.1 RDD family protein [Clostridium botulinum CDC_1436]AXG92087.1 hypothetical protein AGE29_09950 [Clostridium botulinum]EDT85422.1 hypothetical protein CBB_0791 [Clostridium botulinum Bf]KGO13666.1 hypothetical protein NZ45_11600 [Clostridium botulinum]